MKKGHRALLRWFGTFLCPFFLWANDVTLGGVQWSPPFLSFSIQWAHSWNYYDSAVPYNFDACWIFGKYYENGRWQPLLFSSDSGDYAVSGPLRTLPVDDSAGFFLMRRVRGEGAVQATVTLRLPAAVPAGAPVALFAVEMVYVPPGPFYLGDGASYYSLRRAADDSPFYVAGPTVPVGSLSCLDNSQYAPPDTIPATYPIGWNGFFIMKHEISQAAYADFLNFLPPQAQTAHVTASLTDPPGTPAFPQGKTFRNGLVIEQPAGGNGPARFGHDFSAVTPVNDTDDGQTRAMNFLNWHDLTAFLDWAGLRPMTEAEFEKAARGPLRPVTGEFAWGTPNVVDANAIVRDGTPSETHQETIPPGYGIGVHGYAGPSGPLRCGFAARDTTSRRTAGAAYYGAMELSGNVWEMCVSLRESGVHYIPRHGDGALSDSGTADVLGWPSAAGAVYRGGGWNSGIFARFRDLAVSDRFYIYLAPNMRRNTTGGRGVRTYPLQKIYP